MPIYEFECATCQISFEELRLSGESTPPACPECAGPTERLISQTHPWKRTKYSKKAEEAHRKHSAMKDAERKAEKDKREKAERGIKP